MELLTEAQENYIKPLMLGAGIVHYGNPLALFTMPISPQQFHDMLLSQVPDVDDRAWLHDQWVEAYNQHMTDIIFEELTGELEDWNE